MSSADEPAMVVAADAVRVPRDDLRACAAFREVAEALSEGQDLERVLHVIAEKLCQLTGRARCSIHLVEPESGLLHGRVGHAATDIDAQVRRLVSGGPGDGFTREVLATRRPVALVDTLSDPRAVRAAMRRWNARSVLGVPMLLRHEVVGMVCLDDERAATFAEQEQELVAAFADLAATAVNQAQLTTQLRSSLATVATQVEQLGRAAALEERLTEIVLRGSTLRELGDSVAELLGKPCAIYNPRFRRLTFSPGEAGPGRTRPRLLDAEVRAVPAIERQLEGLRPGQPEIVEPAPGVGLHHRLLVSSVVLGSQHLGYIAVAECGQRLSVLDEAVVRRAAVSIALERSGERRAAELEWHTVEAFTGSLLRGEESPEVLERRAEVLGLRLDVPRVVCLVAARDGAGPGVSTHALARLLTGPDCPSAVIGAPCGEDIALILELPDDLAPRDGIRWATRRLRDALRRVDHDGGLFAAVSTVARAPGEDSRGHGECRQVLASMRHHLTLPGDQVLAADDLGAGRLLLATADAADARRFGRDALGPLLGDDDTSRDLLVTLAAFLDGGRSVGRAARLLDVHANAVRYRMARVEKLTGLRVATDADSQLTAQLALLVLRLNGHLPLVSEP